MKKALIVSIFLIFVALIPVALVSTQAAPRLEITGVNPTDLPTIVVTTNVYDSFGQPVGGLTAENFRVVGPLADVAQIVSVSQIEDANLPVAVVLVIDVSTSMEGRPFEQAKEAARAFVNAIGPNDPVAIVAFSSRARLIQDYTPDKTTLLAAIDALPLGGQTSLYEGALLGVQTAAAAPSPRRAVILLSDGAQYDTDSPPRAERAAAAAEAQIRGVSVYTIGLGFGIDRTYLVELSSSTNARNYESPTSEELEQIYRDLAALLRSQYEIVLTADLANDGTEYNLQLEVTTGQGTANANAALRAPIPTPIITLPTLDGAISEPTEITATILADDELVTVDAAVDSATGVAFAEPPYTFLIDPQTLTPGQHILTFGAIDIDGDTSTAALNFEVAPLPSIVEFITEIPEGEISEVTRFGLTITGQTAPASVTIQLDGGDLGTLTSPEYTFTINPFNLAPGEHELVITVLNEAGVTTTIERTLNIADLPPTFEVSGLVEGQTVDALTQIQATVLTTQAQINNIAFELNGEIVDEIASGVIELDPLTITPGTATLTIIIENETGQRSTQTLTFNVPALPPQVTVNGLDLGETIEDTQEITLDIVGQTPVTTINYALDGEVIAGADTPVFTLDPTNLTPGAHILSVTVNTQNGQTTTVEIPFTMGEGPSLTQTAMFTPSATSTPSATLTATPTVTPSPDATQTAAALDAQATAQAQATIIRATTDARQSALAQSAASILTATSEFLREQATASAPITATAQIEQATQTEVAELNSLTATRNAEIEQATVSAQLTQAFEDIDAMANAMATATIQTAEALITATEQAVLAQMTLDARSTVLAGNAQSTLDARQTELAQSARVILTLTREAASANATANADASATSQSALDAQATSTANLMLTENAATQTALDAEATSTAEAFIAATAEITVEPTAEVAQAGTEVATAEATVEPATEAATATGTPIAAETEEDRTPNPSVTPIGTLIPAQAETAPETTSILPIAIIVVVIVLILLIVFLILSRARRRTQ